MKKTLLLLILVVFVSFNISAQQTHKRAVYLGYTGFLGSALCYERKVSHNFSMTFEAEFYFGNWLDLYFEHPVVLAYNASLNARWFPFSYSDGRTVGFFLNAGLGAGYVAKGGSNVYHIYEYSISGALLSPGIGYKFGVNRRRGFVFAPILDVDFFLGKKEYSSKDSREGEFGVEVVPNIRLLFGVGF